MSWVFLIVVASLMFFIGVYVGSLGRQILDKEAQNVLITDGMDRVIAATSLVFTQNPDDFDHDLFFRLLDEVSNNPAQRLQILGLIEAARLQRQLEE